MSARLLIFTRLLTDKNISPPYNSLPDFFRDQPRQAARASRKAAGLPASSDVGELAKLIKALLSEVKTHLGGRQISGAVATIPHLTALYQEDLEDAFEYVGLIYVPQYPYWYGGIFPESGAVYAANGFGLCSKYKNTTSCREQHENPPHQPQHENVLSISFTSGMLASTWSVESMGFAFPASDQVIFVDFHLGLENRNDNPNDDYYWEALRDAVVKPALEAENYWKKKTTKVLPHGDCATDEQFQKVLREVLSRALEPTPEIFMIDPVYAAARGAAEMAKRVQWNYHHANSTMHSGL